MNLTFDSGSRHCLDTLASAQMSHHSNCSTHKFNPTATTTTFNLLLNVRLWQFIEVISYIEIKCYALQSEVVASVLLFQRPKCHLVHPSNLMYLKNKNILIYIIQVINPYTNIDPNVYKIYEVERQLSPFQINRTKI